MPLSLSVFSQSGPPICTPIWAFFRAFKALRALKGPLIKFSHILMHRPYRDILYLKFSCLYLFPFSHKVVPQKASGGGGGSGRIPVIHQNSDGSTAAVLRQYGGSTAAVLRQYGGSTAAVLRQYGGSTAAVLRQYGGSTAAVPRQYCGSAMAV